MIGCGVGKGFLGRFWFLRYPGLRLCIVVVGIGLSTGMNLYRRVCVFFLVA